jgi:hypothetical protein
VTKREAERRLKQQRQRRREQDRERRQRRDALRAAEAALAMAATRLTYANDPELLAHAQRVHQAVRERAVSWKVKLSPGPPPA